MELRQVRYFLAVAEEGHFGRAAERLHLSQPPLTRQIQALEREVGARLFLRTPRGAELTEAGRAFQADAANILALVGTAVARARRAGRGEIGTLDVGIFGSGVLDIVPRLLARFRAAHPQVQVVLHHAPREANLEALRQGRLHAVFDRGIVAEPALVLEPVAREAVLVAMPAGHALAGRELVELGLLRDVPMIAGTAAVDPVWGAMAPLGFTPVVAQRVADVVTALALVARGMGCTLVPESAASVSLPGLVYRPLAGSAVVIGLDCAVRAGEQAPVLAALLAVVRAFRAGGCQVGADAL